MVIEVALATIDKPASSDIYSSSQDQSSNTSDGIREFFRLSSHLLAINDTLQGMRLQRILDAPKGVLGLLSAQRYVQPKFTYTATKFLIPLLLANVAAQQHVLRGRPAWQWLDVWMREYINKPRRMYPLLVPPCSAALSSLFFPSIGASWSAF
jgi:hypothetical protein